MPTLIAWGTGNIFFRLRYAHWLRDTIPGVTEVTIDAGRLFFPDERPDDLRPEQHQNLGGLRPGAAKPVRRATGDAQDAGTRRLG